MKKAVALLIAVMMIAGLCGCTVNIGTPDGTVKGFLDAMKDNDAEALALYIENNDINTLINNNADEETMQTIHKKLMKNISWKIVSVETNDEQTEAIVTVEITNSDFSKVLTDYKKDAVEYMKDNLYDDEVTREVMEAECLKIFAENVSDTAALKDNSVTETVKVKLVKNDTYTWDMEVTKDLTKAAIGGLLWPAAN